MEVYNSQPQDLKISMPSGYSSPVVEVSRDGKRISYSNPTVTGPNFVMARIPYAATTVDGTIRIVVNFNVDGSAQTKVISAQVTTPYASVDEIRDALGKDEARFLDGELNRAERRIRGIVNSFTGQEFGRVDGTKKVTGAGDVQLRLPDRLSSLTRIEGVNTLVNYQRDASGNLVWAYSPDYPGDDSRRVLVPIDNGPLYDIRGDGFYLGLAAPLPQTYSYTNPIRDPDSMWQGGGFRENSPYYVTGIWGYESVPSDVKEATLILIEDALCPDSEYRDRYVDNYKAADWRVEYSDRAFRGTGSVMADQLLEPYRRWSMTVI